jgi:hypothetical protein
MSQKPQEQRKEHDQHLDHPAADTGEPKPTAEDHSVQIYFFSGNPCTSRERLDLEEDTSFTWRIWILTDRY